MLARMRVASQPPCAKASQRKEKMSSTVACRPSLLTGDGGASRTSFGGDHRSGPPAEGELSKGRATITAICRLPGFNRSMNLTAHFKRLRSFSDGGSRVGCPRALAPTATRSQRVAFPWKFASERLRGGRGRRRLLSRLTRRLRARRRGISRPTSSGLPAADAPASAGSRRARLPKMCTRCLQIRTAVP